MGTLESTVSCDIVAPHAKSKLKHPEVSIFYYSLYSVFTAATFIQNHMLE
jgi:hypothetical protein